MLKVIERNSQKTQEIKMNNNLKKEKVCFKNFRVKLTCRHAQFNVSSKLI